MVFVLAIRQLKGLLRTKVYRILMENKNYIMRGSCLLDAPVKEVYIQQYLETSVALKMDKKHCATSNYFYF